MAGDRRAVTPGQLERAALRLSPIEREVLVLSARKRLPKHEIAARLGLTPGAVEQILARAIAALDCALEREERPWWKFW